MAQYRTLTHHEISILEQNACTAEDWTGVMVAEDFAPYHLHGVHFCGEVQLGVFHGHVEVAPGFLKHSGIRNATLRNCVVGDDCLIENIGGYINNYNIGAGCLLSNVSVVQTTEGATFGQAALISVLNEVGEGNVMLFDTLTAQFAAFMVKHAADRHLKSQLRNIISSEVKARLPETGVIGNGCKITNTKEITNALIEDDCEVNGAERLSDCTLTSYAGNTVFVGSGVIIENSIVGDGSRITNSVKIQDCFVGENCLLSNGFTASQSLFFANCLMSNGEACAAFCGPFTASHHKSSLLIGAQFSFYNAGSATNFSNHAYKMGPLHWGVLERGCKTASGAYLLLPATIGTFSVCFGKLMHHPDTRALPFSYLIAYGDVMYLVPGRNLTTVGLYRDIRKWQKRDARPELCRKSIVNFDWLSPFSVQEIWEGKRILEGLRDASGEISSYNYHEYMIKGSNLRQGISWYDMALKIYMGAVLKRVLKWDMVDDTCIVGQGKWTDLSGLLLPESEELRLIEDIKNGTVDTITEIHQRFQAIHAAYRQYLWAWTRELICQYYNVTLIDARLIERIQHDYVAARREWIAEIRKDAEKEFDMGDVEKQVLENFLEKLDSEADYEQ